MIYFDLTSSALWGGHPVGIIRVERGAFEGLRQRLGSAVQPVIFHQKLKTYFAIRPDILELLIRRRATLNMDMVIPSEVDRELSSNRMNSASWLRIFDAVQEWSAKESEKAERDMCEDWRRHVVPNQFGSTSVFVPFFSAVSGPVYPTVGDSVVSCGLDWDDKDICAIEALKRFNGFSYIQFIYDVVPVRYPQFVVPEIREKIAAFFHRVAKVADFYLCISDTTLREWSDWLDDNGYGIPPSAVISLAVDIRQVPAKTPPAERLPSPLRGKKFALYVSSIEPRKNHLTVYLAWKDAVRQGVLDPEEHKLVFIGMTGWLSADLMRAIEADRELSESIVILHGVSDAELTGLYAACRFSIFPSFHEGFGLGLAESLNQGKFAVSSDRGALPEVGGKFAEYLDPDDIPAWSAAFALYMSDDAALASRERRLNQYTTIDWRVAVLPILEFGM